MKFQRKKVVRKVATATLIYGRESWTLTGRIRIKIRNEIYREQLKKSVETKIQKR